jgi:RNase P subunit RPR2
VIPIGEGLVASSPSQPVRGVAGRGAQGELDGEQAGDLGEGQRDHPGVGRWRLAGAEGRRRLGIGAPFELGGGQGSLCEFTPYPGAITVRQLMLPHMDEPLAELAGYFRAKSKVRDEDLVRLIIAARACGSRWDAIASACGVRTYEDAVEVVCQPSGIIPRTPADVLFHATQHSAGRLSGGRYQPLAWPCLECGRKVTDRAAVGRPMHVELGHAPRCTRLARDQAVDADRRQAELPCRVLHSECAFGRLQRHWLREPITDDCPRCGWHGRFDHYIATIGGRWNATVCDNCYADLNPRIAVTVRFFLARSPCDYEPFVVIRQRTRSDHKFPDTGQMMTWQLSWEHTTVLIDNVRGNCEHDIRSVGRYEAEQIAARLAARYWPPQAGRLPWVVSAYPQPGDLLEHIE